MKKAPIAFVCLLGCMISSCNNGKKKTSTDSATVMAAAPGGGSDNCITLTRDMMVKWLKPGWTDSTNANYIRYLIFTPTNGATISVIGCPVDQAGVAIVAEQEPFTIKPGSSPCSFLPLTLNPNKYYFQTENFADSNNQLIPFTLLRLKPRPYSADTAYMSFDVEIATKTESGEQVTAKGESKPSPPAQD